MDKYCASGPTPQKTLLGWTWDILSLTCSPKLTHQPWVWEPATGFHSRQPHYIHVYQSHYWAVQWSWFARVNALCNLSLKMSWEAAASLPGRFLSRRCFTLCITMEVEPRIAKQYKCHHCCSCKNYRGKGMESGGKNVFASFFGWPEDCDFMEKMCFGASYSTSNKLLFVVRHILTTGLQKYL